MEDAVPAAASSAFANLNMEDSSEEEDTDEEDETPKEAVTNVSKPHQVKNRKKGDKQYTGKPHILGGIDLHDNTSSEESEEEIAAASPGNRTFSSTCSKKNSRRAMRRVINSQNQGKS
eukprot:gb/GECG01007004.1/.p1 GENE.gb/GECG01007004.1/~~gb/GECG01007004.1/.p1  ORF type:complete len:118 (+),score=29.47 gb/GECG01007004.1/:1-354(+)